MPGGGKAISFRSRRERVGRVGPYSAPVRGLRPRCDGTVEGALFGNARSPGETATLRPGRPQLVAGELGAARHPFPRRQQPPATLPAGPAPRPPRFPSEEQAAASGPGRNTQPPPGSGRSRPRRWPARVVNAVPVRSTTRPAALRRGWESGGKLRAGTGPERGASPGRSGAQRRPSKCGSRFRPPAAPSGQRQLRSGLNTPRRGHFRGAGAAGRPPDIPRIFFFFSGSFINLNFSLPLWCFCGEVQDSRPGAGGRGCPAVARGLQLPHFPTILLSLPGSAF